MFPEAEIARLRENSAQITEVNAIEHIYGAICDWVTAGAKAQVFPHYADAPLEFGLDLSALFGA